MSTLDPFSSLWESAVKAFESEHGCHLASIAPNAHNITPEEILNEADLDFNTFRKKGETLRSIIKPFTDTLLSISNVLGQSIKLAFPPGEAITAAVIVLIKESKQFGENYDAIRDLLADLQFLLHRMRQYAGLDHSQQVKDMIVDSLIQTLNVISLAVTASKDGRCRAFLKTLIHKDKKIQEVMAKLDKLSTREGHTMSLSILKATTDILKVVELGIASHKDHSQTVQSILSAIVDKLPSIKDEIVDEVRQLSTPIIDAIRQKELEKIKPKFRFKAEHDACLEGTRPDILGSIYSWIENIDAPNVFWLYGHPGTGKSAIATTVRHHLADQSRLGATCFFRREDTDFHKPRDVLLSIAFDLAMKHDFIGTCMIKKLQEGELDVEDASLSKLFQNLVVNTLHEVAPGFNDSIVIVVDALDEFGGMDPYNNPQAILLHTLLPQWNKLPSRFKLFVTSRAQGDLSSYLKVDYNRFQSLEVGEDATPQSFKDIRHLFEVRLSQTAQRRGRVDWTPSASDLDVLADAASGLFIWASTVVNLVSRRRTQFDQIMIQVHNGSLAGSTPLAGLERLYQTILEAAGQDWDVQTLATVCGAIIIARVPLSCSALSSLLQLDERDVDDIISYLRPVLATSSELRFVHKSFVDYMTSDRCPKEHRCIALVQEQYLLDACFAVMERELHFDMGSVESSYLLNKDIPGLIERISEPTKYGCRFWGSHLEISKLANAKTEPVIRRFFERFFLYWLEVMSIVGCIDEAMRSLTVLSTNIETLRQDLAHQAQEANLFIQTFTVPISQSYPHIYLSALPFSPRHSFIRSQYIEYYPSSIKVLSGLDIRWSPQRGVLLGHEDGVTAVAFSPHGKRIISASWDKSIRLWDAATKQPIGDPLLGHDDGVTSVAFSPDGKQVVSASRDQTIRLWDAATQLPISEPLRGHEGTVSSVAFSPDGKRIISASRDKTIRLWDAATQQPIGEPLRGHENAVDSAVFTPNGKQIVSASRDQTLRLWNAATQQPMGTWLEGQEKWITSVACSPDGKQIATASRDATIRLCDAATLNIIGEALRGHEEIINSVAFSPDGKQIVSSSRDATIRFWDAVTQQHIGRPLRGHEDLVNSVVFSPDGKQVASASEDATIRLWDAAIQQPIGEPLVRGHEGPVLSVAFSPDGKHIASASWDKTIRLWNAATHQPIGEPLQGHKKWVISVAFSPDGKKIVSASADHTIRLWDIATQQSIGEPLEGHQNWVKSAAFSPDGKRVVSASQDKTIRLWDVAAQQPIGEPLEGHEECVTSAAFSPDGKEIVSASVDKTIRLWDTATHQPIGEPLEGHEKWITSVAFSPDGKQIVSASDDHTIRLWDAVTRLPIGEPLRGHTDAVTSVAFSPDGEKIISASLDQTICLWNGATRHLVGEPLQGHDYWIASVTFSPDGKQIVSASADHTVRLWDACSPLELEYLTSCPPNCKKRIRGAGSPPLFLLIDGWVLSSLTLDRLFWVPHHLQSYIESLGMINVMGKRCMVTLDLTSFQHGESWTRCQG